MEKWCLAGLLLIVLEACSGFTVIFFILGLAAICVGSFVQYAPEFLNAQNPISQMTALFGFISIWGALLYPILSKLKLRKKGEYLNIIGQQAEVIEAPLKENSVGKIKWSGTIAKAMLAPNEMEAVVGNIVIIVEIKENVFIVKHLLKS